MCRGKSPALSSQWRRMRAPYPLWGRCHGTSHAVPPRALEETLDSACQIGQHWHHSVVPSLKALSRLFMESPKRRRAAVSMGFRGELYIICGASIEVSSLVAKSHHSLADSKALKGGRCVGCAILEVKSVLKSPFSIVTPLLGKNPFVTYRICLAMAHSCTPLVSRHWYEATRGAQRVRHMYLAYPWGTHMLYATGNS
jgi:hypothetical protein